MFAQVTLVIESKSDVLSVPRSAIITGSPPAVMIVSDGVARRVEIKTGFEDETRVEVVEGLNEGDQVILDAASLRDGERIALARSG